MASFKHSQAAPDEIGLISDEVYGAIPIHEMSDAHCPLTEDQLAGMDDPVDACIEGMSEAGFDIDRPLARAILLRASKDIEHLGLSAMSMALSFAMSGDDYITDPPDMHRQIALRVIVLCKMFAPHIIGDPNETEIANRFGFSKQHMNHFIHLSKQILKLSKGIIS